MPGYERTMLDQLADTSYYFSEIRSRKGKQNPPFANHVPANAKSRHIFKTQKPVCEFCTVKQALFNILESAECLKQYCGPQSNLLREIPRVAVIVFGVNDHVFNPILEEGGKH